MTTTATTLATLAALALALGACNKNDDAGNSNPTPNSAAKTVSAKPAKIEQAVIASMGLTLDVPADSMVNDNTPTAGFPSGTVYASPTIFVVGANDMFWKQDLASQKTEIEKDPGNTFKKFTKEETSDGGFHLEYELASMMDPNETLYGFHLRTTIEGKQVDCSSNTQSPDEMARGVAMCKTLRASN